MRHVLITKRLLKSAFYFMFELFIQIKVMERKENVIMH